VALGRSIAAGLLAVACSLTSLDSLDDNASPTLDAGAGTGGTGGGSNACVPSCERAMQAGCHAFTTEACLLDCQSKGESLASECVTAYGALLLCAGESGSYICDGSGKPALVTCASEAAALAACSGSSTGGAGAMGGSGGGSVDSGACDPGDYLGASCTQISTANQECSDCVMANCCAEFDACFVDSTCAGLYACTVTCSEQPDFTQCVTDSCTECISAVPLYNPMTQCISDHCSTQCSM
jgi:hypothetical protein